MTSCVSSDPALWVKSIISDFLARPSENMLWNRGTEKAWDDPLVGFSRGDDPLYEDFKEYVASFHWTPVEIFSRTFPRCAATAAALTVISWILPQTEATKADNRKEVLNPSERWARTRIFGEEINISLAEHVVGCLRAAGYEALAPMLLPELTWQDSERFGFAANWSERHAAYASGLGTFGLCDGLITSRGKAMRAGSVIARIRIPTTERPYASHREYCLFFSRGGCKKCIERCPVGAITESGHDKIKCLQHLHATTAPHVRNTYGFDGYGCGLCQTGVPCESGIPGTAGDENGKRRHG